MCQLEIVGQHGEVVFQIPCLDFVDVKFALHLPQEFLVFGC